MRMGLCGAYTMIAYARSSTPTIRPPTPMARNGRGLTKGVERSALTDAIANLLLRGDSDGTVRGTPRHFNESGSTAAVATRKITSPRARSRASLDEAKQVRTESCPCRWKVGETGEALEARMGHMDSPVVRPSSCRATMGGPPHSLRPGWSPVWEFCDAISTTGGEWRRKTGRYCLTLTCIVAIVADCL